MKKAVIFDMDGVISDTQKFHSEIESTLLSKFEIVMSPEEITQKYAGVSDEKMFQELFENYSVKTHNMDEVIAMKWNKMREMAEGKIAEVPGAIELIHSLTRNKLKLAVASASPLLFIHSVIESLGIRSFFDTLVSSQEVIHGKPAPDIFLLTAKRLHVSPEDCVVIEDGRSGMIGAKDAQMKCIGLVQDTQSKWPADLLITSLKHITPEIILNI